MLYRAGRILEGGEQVCERHLQQPLIGRVADQICGLPRVISLENREQSLTILDTNVLPTEWHIHGLLRPGLHRRTHSAQEVSRMKRLVQKLEGRSVRVSSGNHIFRARISGEQ